MDRLAVGLSLVGFALALWSAGTAGAGTIMYESGGISSLAAVTSTEGTYDHPWTISEDMTAGGALTFARDATGPLVGAPGTQPLGSDCLMYPLECDDDDARVGFHQSKWISKTVTNIAGSAWGSFRIELPDPNDPSNTDGLSFAKTYPDNSPVVFESTRFSSYSYTFDTWGDYLTFYVGVVAPGDPVTFKFVIVDTSENDRFSLLQTPIAVPEPATLAFLATGLLFLGVGRRLLSYASRLRHVSQPSTQL